MTLTKTQKWLSVAFVCGGIGTGSITFVRTYLGIDKMQEMVTNDHDKLTRIETKVENIERLLERNKIVVYEKQVRQNTNNDSYALHIGW